MPSYTSMEAQKLILIDSENLHTFQWAKCRKTGYHKPRDPWDLPLKLNQKVKVLRDMGKDWCIAEDMDGRKGWVHMAILDVSLERVVNFRKAHVLFHEETAKMLQTGGLRVFPDLSKYVCICAEPGCKNFKKDPAGLGVCVHDLEMLLKGSENYGLPFLKAERTRWHPDKFPRICHPDHQEELMAKAGRLFALCGVLMFPFQDKVRVGNDST
ncbi:hypothetical protein P154DRAFT_559641 [Amniculicola lignicola CBS 123094]|uniref:SH3 domain-containing protein n=1 Tax=Amniculicola lignicola CBS 123094 TaxID=1392246 RepID=A0A6A5WYC1_9PLEO|nr:hypothetical protein P154DRAFT_559641 [Amniculicola lignicola CBS 123094]